MLSKLNILKPSRILSIDAFRGITFLIMIFVNEVHELTGVPDWMKHTLADTDGMHFPDVVFPAFLFIVGMSIPFGINSRLVKGCSFWQLQGHILYRAFGLIVMGVFMVNAEDGFNAKAMGMSIDAWSLLFYAAIMFTWGVYRFESIVVNRILRAVGVVMIVALGLIYRSGADGTGGLTTQWWGILGLIGWAYLVSCIAYQIARGRVLPLLAMIAACFAYYMVSHLEGFNHHPLLGRDFYQDLHAAHAAIALCGLVCAIIFFDAGRPDTDRRRLIEGASFFFLLVVAGYLLHPMYIISKIYATPTWCLYSAAICVAIFGLLYWLIDVKKSDRWVRLVEPAASNPLITYLVPFVVTASMGLFGLALPAVLREGAVGILYCAVYAMAVVYLVSWMNKFNLRLKL